MFPLVLLPFLPDTKPGTEQKRGNVYYNLKTTRIRQDIQSGIEIRYDADLRKAKKEQKSKKRAEAKAKRIQALERKLLEVGYENLESYSLDKVHADKWLEPERIQDLTELREKRIEEEKNKPVQLSLPLEALLP